MSKQQLPEFDHYQHNAPEYTESILWHRVYAAATAVVLIIALVAWGIYTALYSDSAGSEFNVETLAPTAALPDSDVDANPKPESQPEPEPETKPAAQEASTDNEPPPVTQTKADREQSVADTAEAEPEAQSVAEAAPEPAQAEPTQAEPVTADTSSEPTTEPKAATEPKADSRFTVNTSIQSSDISAAALTDRMQELEPARVLDSTAALQDGFLKLYFYTDLQGHAGDTLIYSWYRNDKRVAKVRIPVGSDRWRSHASKNISAEMRGDWKVEVTDRRGNTLATSTFYLK